MQSNTMFVFSFWFFFCSKKTTTVQRWDVNHLNRKAYLWWGMLSRSFPKLLQSVTLFTVTYYRYHVVMIIKTFNCYLWYLSFVDIIRYFFLQRCKTDDFEEKISRFSKNTPQFFHHIRLWKLCHLECFSLIVFPQLICS